MLQPGAGASSSCPSTPQMSRPPSAEFTMFPIWPKDTSLLSAILPSMVRGRLPRLSSIRRSVSMYGLRRQRRCDSRSRPGTQPSEDISMVLRIVKTRDKDIDVAESDHFVDDTNDEEGTFGKEQPGAVELTEQKSGTQWKFASQGFSLLSLSISESNALAQDQEVSDVSPLFARQLYIHALTYLLRGLPGDLTTEEGLSIRFALPRGISGPLRLEIDEATIASYHDHDNELEARSKSKQPSVIHRLLAVFIVYSFIFIQFTLPYLKIFLRTAYEYERTHHIFEKLLASSIETVDRLGRVATKGRGVIWGSALAVSIAETVNWVIQGVSGGIQEGLNEGMARVGVKSEDDMKQDKTMTMSLRND